MGEAQSKPKSKHFSKVIIQYDPCIYENRKQGMKSIVFASFGFSMRTLKEFFFPEKKIPKKRRNFPKEGNFEKSLHNKTTGLISPKNHRNKKIKPQEYSTIFFSSFFSYEPRF